MEEILQKIFALLGAKRCFEAQNGKICVFWGCYDVALERCHFFSDVFQIEFGPIG